MSAPNSTNLTLDQQDQDQSFTSREIFNIVAYAAMSLGEHNFPNLWEPMESLLSHSLETRQVVANKEN